jgi:hypothetical protein
MDHKKVTQSNKHNGPFIEITVYHIEESDKNDNFGQFIDNVVKDLYVVDKQKKIALGFAMSYFTPEGSATIIPLGGKLDTDFYDCNRDVEVDANMPRIFDIVDKLATPKKIYFSINLYNFPDDSKMFKNNGVDDHCWTNENTVYD